MAAGPELSLREDLFVTDEGPMRMCIGAYPGRDALINLVQLCGAVVEEEGEGVMTFNEAPRPGQCHINFVLDSLSEGKMPPLALHFVPSSLAKSSSPIYHRTPDERRLVKKREREKARELQRLKKDEKEKEKATRKGKGKGNAKEKEKERSESDEEEEPPKRKRGRPRKKAPPTDDDNSEAPVVKRKRGRPRKDRTTAAAAEAEAETEPPVKKRRGRPPKNATKSTKSNSETSKKRARSPSPIVGNSVRRNLDFASQAPDDGADWDDVQMDDSGALDSEQEEYSSPPPAKRKKASEESVPTRLRTRRQQSASQEKEVNRSPRRKRLRRAAEPKYLGDDAMDEEEEQEEEEVEDLRHLEKKKKAVTKSRARAAREEEEEKEEEEEDLEQEDSVDQVMGEDHSLEELDQALDEEEDYDGALILGDSEDDANDEAIAEALRAIDESDDVLLDGGDALVAGTESLGLVTERNSLERARGVVEHLCRLCARPREVVVHALIVTSGSVEDAYAYIRNPLAYIESRDISQNVWSFSEDACLLNAEPEEMTRIIARRTAEATAARVAFLES